MRLQRVRVAGSRIEMQADKWTVEGIVKSGKLESIQSRSFRVREEECVGILQRAPVRVKQGGTAGLYLLPVLDFIEDGLFIYGEAC